MSRRPNLVAEVLPTRRRKRNRQKDIDDGDVVVEVGRQDDGVDAAAVVAAVAAIARDGAADAAVAAVSLFSS